MWKQSFDGGALLATRRRNRDEVLVEACLNIIGGIERKEKRE
jgi:hypothetical protein